MKQAKTDPLLGHDIAGRYRIEAKIGEGGMGSVYRARNVVTGKAVAIKVLLQELAAYQSFVQRFLHEAQAAAYLNHPHAINIIDCGQEKTLVYLLMEYVEGQTLTEVLREEGPFPVGRAANIMRQICAAVADAHAQSIVHRDLKPDNIMLQRVAGETDYVKVLDFGIAKVLDEQKRGPLPVSKNIFVGTPEYASPEQCNSKSPTYLSDIYSLGTILYDMLTGAPPFTGDPMEVMLKHVNEEPRPVRELRPDLSPEVEAVLQRALSKDPARRQQHVLELAQEFDAAALTGREYLPWERSTGNNRVNGMLVSASHPTESATRSSGSAWGWKFPSWVSRLRRNRWPVLLIAVILVISGDAGYRFFSWYQASPRLPTPPRLLLPVPPSLPAHPLGEAERLFDEGNRELAVRELHRLLQHDQGFNPHAHFLLGRVYFDQGDYGGARSEFTTAIEQMNGRYPDAHYSLGCLWLNRGKLAEARDEFQKAMTDSGGQHLPTLVSLEELALRNHEGSEAERLFRRVLAQASDDPSDVLQVGRVLLLREQADLAVRELRRAVNSKAGVFPQAELYLGRALLAKSELDQAVSILQQAVQHRGGNYPEARLTLGSALYRLQRYDAAIGEVRAAIRLRGGNYPQAEFVLGTILADWAIGEYDEGQRLLELAISHRGGTFDEAEEALARLNFARLGRLEEARKIWTRLPAGEWLGRTADAYIIRAGTGVKARRMIGSGLLHDGQRLSFHITPLPAQNQAPHIRVEIGQGAVILQFTTDETGNQKLWNALVSSPNGQQLLQLKPIDLPLLGKISTHFSIAVYGTRAVLHVDQEEVGPFEVNPPVQVLASITGGHAIIFSLRVESASDETDPLVSGAP